MVIDMLYHVHLCSNIDDLIDFSRNNIYSVNDSKFLLEYLKGTMNTYIVSTSYGQYIEAVSNYMEVPFENTFYTNVNVDELELTGDEIEKINEYKNSILENPDDYDALDQDDILELSNIFGLSYTILFSFIYNSTPVFNSLNFNFLPPFNAVAA